MFAGTAVVVVMFAGVGVVARRAMLMFAGTAVIVVMFARVVVIARRTVFVPVGMVAIMFMGVAVIARPAVLVPIDMIVITHMRRGMASAKPRFIGFLAVCSVGLTHDSGFRGGFVV
ncbi:hypothetical protein [Paraburkholderia acidicola]|uniref:hypothetical protein n=1 Tax=Paraburkholderia acidicola TaxID=1912599 RepID=UPI001F1BCDA7|nr:hypothetical protein [Paraburkholderia acidicola]